MLDEHDKREIDALIAFKEQIKKYRKLSEKEKEIYLIRRWKNEQIGEDNF